MIYFFFFRKEEILQHNLMSGQLKIFIQTVAVQINA